MNAEKAAFILVALVPEATDDVLAVEPSWPVHRPRGILCHGPQAIGLNHSLATSRPEMLMRGVRFGLADPPHPLCRGPRGQHGGSLPGHRDGLLHLCQPRVIRVGPEGAKPVLRPRPPSAVLQLRLLAGGGGGNGTVFTQESSLATSPPCGPRGMIWGGGPACVGHLCGRWNRCFYHHLGSDSG